MMDLGEEPVEFYCRESLLVNYVFRNFYWVCNFEIFDQLLKRLFSTSKSFLDLQILSCSKKEALHLREREQLLKVAIHHIERRRIL